MKVAGLSSNFGREEQDEEKVEEEGGEEGVAPFSSGPVHGAV